MALLQRRSELNRSTIEFVLDGRPAAALQGDTVLTAILVQADAVRHSDTDGGPRAGFCLMGACQDCWVVTASGARLRACTTQAADGMNIRTNWA